MSAVTLDVTDVFRVSSTPGPILFCRASGVVNVGDVFALRFRTGQVLHGTVFTINPHRRPNAGPDELNLGVEGPSAPYLEAGVRLVRVGSPVG